MTNQTTPPQSKFFDDQDVLDADIDKLYQNFIVPIDSIRSHFNALVNNAQEQNSPQYQESRCHAFYRMIGFPVVDPNGGPTGFYSPGFDPNLNTDQAGIATNKQIAQNIINNNNFISKQLSPREQIYKSYAKIFSVGDITSQAVALGSIFIRSFDKQFSGTDPFVYDPNQIQTVNDRLNEIAKFFGPEVIMGTTSTTSIGVSAAVATVAASQSISSILGSIVGTANNVSVFSSNHLLKPFIVDPRIDSGVRPNRNRICAPFLKDKSQTKLFQSQTGTSDSLSRPYIEKVISTRFNNQNVTTLPGGDFINKIIEEIKADFNVTDPELISVISSPLEQLNQSDLTIFNNYFKIIRSLVQALVESITEIEYIRANMNWQPIPDSKNGVEAGTNGGKIPDAVPNDPNNMTLENDIIQQTRKKYINDIEFSVGLQGVADPGDFVFSSFDDTVFNVNKSVQKSFDETLQILNDGRNQLGNSGIDYLKDIEIIMGEFSGLGLIDIVAIQAALWLMDPNALLGLIDQRAIDRINDFWPNVNIKGANTFEITLALSEFEVQLTTIYKIIQAYYDSLISGQAFNSS